ncbi:MAG TPA: NAD-dependent epimerase/dehydratase family protein [Burkholderiales bacterium]|nr:NAD-dependent epimerase/dehydratase family protein [Burkholderiales bacterium]
MSTKEQTICVAGASGLVGSNIVRAALERGYRVHGTLRDVGAPDKASFLNALPHAPERLKLFSADMSKPDSFDAALAGADGVFIACLIPTYSGPSGKPAREMDDAQAYAEIIMPTVDGCINIMRSAVRRGVRKIVICSSTSSTNPVPPVAIKNEVDHWSDEKQQCQAKKYTSAAKTVMEKAAIRFAEENGVRLCIIMPTGLYGPVILPEHLKHNPYAWLQRLINGGEGRHSKMPNDSASMIHLHDLAALFLAAYENPAASGRYYGVYDSWHWQDIYGELQKLLPDMKMPEALTEPPQPPTGFDFSRRDSLGVPLRNIPKLMRQTVEWLKSEPFAGK